MRFTRRPRCEYAVTDRKRAAAVRLQRRQREKLPLLAPLIAEAQPGIDEVMATRVAHWVEWEQRDRDRRAAKWREARRPRQARAGDAAGAAGLLERPSLAARRFDVSARPAARLRQGAPHHRGWAGSPPRWSQSRSARPSPHSGRPSRLPARGSERACMDRCAGRSTPAGTEARCDHRPGEKNDEDPSRHRGAQGRLAA